MRHTTRHRFTVITEQQNALQRRKGIHAIALAQRMRGDRVRPTVGWESLTPTELLVVELVVSGKTNPQIAEQLLLSRATVKTHLVHVYEKLGLRTRAELAVMASRRSFTATT